MCCTGNKIYVITLHELNVNCLTEATLSLDCGQLVQKKQKALIIILTCEVILYPVWS